MILRQESLNPNQIIPNNTEQIILILKYYHAVYKATFTNKWELNTLTLTNVKLIYEDIKGREHTDELTTLLNSDILILDKCHRFRILTNDITYITGTLYTKSTIEEKIRTFQKTTQKLHPPTAIYLLHTIHALITGETCNLPLLDEDKIIPTLLQLFNEDQIQELLCICHSNDKLINIILETIDNYD